MTARHPHHAQLIYLLSLVGFVIMGACVKGTGPHIPVHESVFFRSAIATVIIGCMMLRERTGFRAAHLPLLLLRGVSGLVAILCNYYALTHLPLGDASVLTHTFPLWAVFLALALLGEKIPRSLLGWTLLAWVGIALVLRPQLVGVNYAGFMALLAAFFIALNAVVIRKSHQHDPSLRIAWYFSTICTVATAPVLLQFWVRPTPAEWWLLLGAGLSGTFGQILLTRAYGMIEVGRLAPLSYLGVPASFGVGLLIWHEVPTWWSIAGTALVIWSCLQIFRYQPPTPVINRP